MNMRTGMQPGMRPNMQAAPYQQGYETYLQSMNQMPGFAGKGNRYILVTSKFIRIQSTKKIILLKNH